MKHIITAERLVLGFLFLVTGLNIFFNFLPMPPPAPGVVPFMTGVMSTKYFFPLLGLTQVVVGAFLLLNIFVPLALILLAPVALNIFFFHLFLDPNMVMPVVILALELSLAYFYRDSYKALFVLKAPAKL